MTIAVVIAVAVVAVVLGVVGYFVIYPAIRKKMFSCSQCKTHYDYDRDVEWSPVKEFSSQSGEGSHKEYKNNVEVKFTCHCPKCGKVESFNKTFVTAKLKYGNGTPSNQGYDKSYNLEELIKKYYK